MIYTVTFNPSIDYVMHLSKFIPGETNRASQEQIYPGGKGLNVSMVLKQLGKQSVAWGFIAGFTGDKIADCMKEKGISCDFIRLEQGISRINVKLKTDIESEINGIGPVIEKRHIQSFMSKINHIQSRDIVVLAGSVPKTVPSFIYGEICRCVHEKGGKTVVDASGELLLQTLAYKPFLIKPNMAELEELFKVKIQSEQELIGYGTQLIKMGAGMVLISRGREGAVLITKDCIYIQQAPEGNAINSVGAGDSMVAGFLTGLLDKKDVSEALRMGVAAGSASAFSAGLADRQQIEKVMHHISEQSRYQWDEGRHGSLS